MITFWKTCNPFRRISASLILLVHLITFSHIQDAFAYSAQSQNYKINSGTSTDGGGVHAITDSFIQSSGLDGIVCFEVESFDNYQSQGGYEWEAISYGGNSGSGSLKATPNNGRLNNTGYVTSSPRLDYKINFVKTGTHYIWARGIGANGNDDSYHAGLDGAAISTCDRISYFYGDWTWSKTTMDSSSPATFNVSETGIHTFNIWMREDGFVIDKIVITTNPNYIPSGLGPERSSKAGLQYTIGEPIATKSQSPQYVLNSGFIATILSNPPQQIQIISNFNWQENESLPDAFDLDDYFMSPDGIDLTYSVRGNDSIVVDIDETTHLVSFSQASGWAGTESVIFTAADTQGNSVDSNEVSLQVEDVNNPPVLDFISDISVSEGQLVTISPHATDADVDDTVTYSFTTPLDVNGQWQTDFNDSGEYTVTVTATDSGGLIDSQDVQIFVVNVNRPPVLDPMDPITANEGDLVTINPSATDPDNDAITFYFSSPFDTQGKWQTGYEDANTYTITVIASDGTDTVSRDVIVTINNVNRAPQATLTLSPYTAEPNQTIDVTLTATDPDGDSLIYTLKKDGEQIGFGLFNSPYQTTITIAEVGDHVISAQVVDPLGLMGTDQKGVDIVDSSVNQYRINPVMGDFNGDSLSDLGVHDSTSGKWEVCLSDKGVFTNSVDWLTGFGTSIDWLPIGGDFNGDGVTDIGAYNNKNGELYVGLSDGSSFANDGLWLDFANASTTWQPFTGNFNGDKYADFGVYRKDTGELRIATGTGSGFNSFNTWLNNFGTDGRVLLPGDFNGDGLTDIATFRKATGEWKVAFSTTNGFAPFATAWMSNYAKDQDPIISDFNNDGYADIGYRDKSTYKWHYAVSNGTQFIDKGVWIGSFASATYDSAHTGDFNGDGLIDAAVFDRADQGIDRWTIQLNTQPKVDLLVEINNGIGGKTQVTYEYAAVMQNDQVPFPVYVAKSISSIDSKPIGSPQEVYTQNFSYSGGWFDAEEREFRGFKQVTVTDPITNNHTETYFYQGKADQGGGSLKGKIEKIFAYDGTGLMISEAHNTWEVREAGPESNSLGFPYIKETIATAYEENSSSITTKNTLSYDNIGNVTETINHGDLNTVGDEKYSYTTYNQAYDLDFNTPNEVVLKDENQDTVSWKKFPEYDTAGNLKKEEVWLYNPITAAEQWLASTYQYDSFGNLTQMANPKNSKVTTVYEQNFYAYPQSVTNDLGHTITYEYNTKLGVVTKVTDANNQSTQTFYDAMGRVTYTQNANNEIVTSYSYPDFNTKITTQDNLTSTVYVDGLGRAYKTISQGEDGTNPRNVVTEVGFNNRGQKEWESAPHYEGELEANISYVRYEYDIRGRAKKTISDFPGTAKDAYAMVNYISPLYTESTNPKGVRKGATKDVYGNNIKITEFTQGGVYDTHYEYDDQGNLIRTTDAQNNIIQIWYDSLGRKIKMDDPDMGLWSYEYDEVGNLIKQTDAKNQVLEFEYDIINRLNRKFTGSTTLAQYHYDDGAKDYCTGRLSKVTDQSGQTEFFYDKLGREVKSAKTIDATAYTVERTYDILDRLTSLKYPDGEIVNYSYDANSGLLEQVQGNSTYVSDIDYSAQGQIKTINYGNNTQTTYSYGQDQRLQRILTQGSIAVGTVQDLNYIFDKNGNLTTLTDNLKTNIRTYEYDNLDRLKAARDIPNSLGGYSDFTYQYDSIGNMTYKSDIGVMAYGVNAGPHAVTSAGANSYQYDANGNMVNRKGDTLTYDIENRLVSTSGLLTTDYVYDGDGGRVKKTTTNGADTTETIYVGSLYEITDGAIKKHIFAGSNKVCTIEPGHTYYMHSDHLGSSNVITDETGNKVSQTEYQPYGKVSYQEGADLTNYKFTGKELDANGLYYYGARYYDAEIGRFISADTIVQAPFNPQTLNRYTYCANNPLKYIDPSGHFFWIAVIIGAILGGISAAQNDQPVWQGVLLGAASAALIAGPGAAFGFLGVVTAGAVSGAANAAVFGGDIGIGALTGGISAGIGFGLGNAAGGNFWGGLAAAAVAGGLSGGIASVLQGGDFGEGSYMGAAYGTAGYLASAGLSKLNKKSTASSSDSGSLTEEIVETRYEDVQLVVDSGRAEGSTLGLTASAKMLLVTGCKFGSEYFKNWKATFKQYAPNWSKGVGRASNIQSGFQALSILIDSKAFIDIIKSAANGNISARTAYAGIGVHATAMIVKSAVTGYGARWGAKMGAPFGHYGPLVGGAAGAVIVGGAASWGVGAIEQSIFRKIGIE